MTSPDSNRPDIHYSRLRTRRIRNLRGLYQMAGQMFQSASSVDFIRGAVDQELRKLGADTESGRRIRHREALEKSEPVDIDALYKKDAEIGHALYEEWVKDGGHFRYPL